MNAFAWIALAALVGSWLVEFVAGILQLRRRPQGLPPEFRDVFDEPTYRRSLEYGRARTRFALIPATVDLIATLAFWWLGGFAWLDERVRSLEMGTLATGIVYIGLLLFAQGALMLPFRAWSVFRIEERFGFNKTTPRTFMLDTLKGVLLAVVIGAPLLALVLWFLEVTGEQAWLWCWLATSAFALLVQFIAPAWILPLFHRYEPLPEGPLREAILAYARKVGFPVRDVYVIDGSRRSTKGNAFFTGIGKNRRIALYDTLVERHSTDELVAVLAHEIGHFRLRHIRKRLVISVLHTGLLFFLLGQFLSHPEVYEAFGVTQPSAHVGLVLFGLFLGPIELLAQVVLNRVSRRHEYEADAFAAETTGAPRLLAHALTGLSRDNLTDLTPHPFEVALHHSHPPVLQRIRALERLAERSAA